MGLPSAFPRARVIAAATAVLALAAGAFVVGYGGSQPLPEEPAEAVVAKFYDRISEARLRGGTLLLKEAFKLVSSERSRLSEAKFVEIVRKYPSGFTVSVVGTEIAERHAEVTIEYRLPSMFGNGFTVRNVVPLNVDEPTNSWKIDFTGETDGQGPMAAAGPPS